MYTVDVSADFFKEAVESSPIVIFHSSLTDVRTLIDWLDSQGLDFRSVEMPMANRQHRELFQHLSETYAWHSLPMIFLNGQFVGGEPELRLALQRGETDSVRLMAWLGYGGVLPFILGALILGVVHPSLQPFFGTMLLSYGAVILSFVGAVHWGWVIAGGASGKMVHRHLLWSVVPALIGWLTLTLPFGIGAAIQAVLFLIAWHIDLAWYPEREDLRFFRTLRTHLSFVVVGSLMTGIVVQFLT